MRRFRVITSIILAFSILLCSCGKVQINNKASDYINAINIIQKTLELNDGYLNFNCSEKEWTSTIKKLKEDIKTKNMSDDTINYRIQQILAMQKDGHLNYILPNNHDLYFPIKGAYFNNKFYIVGASNHTILGGELISINDIAFKDIEKKYSKIISHENNQLLRSSIQDISFTKSQFEFLDIWKKNNIFKIKQLNGNIVKVKLTPITVDKLSKLAIDPNNTLAYDKQNKLIRNTQPKDSSRQYWYTIDSTNRILYFQYNTCFDKHDSVPIKDTSNYPDFVEFSKNLSEYMKDNINSFDKIVVDVRYNTGGNSDHLDKFIDNNLQLLNSKKVYVLMSKTTFSAGTIAVDSLVQKCNATMIGEETGGPADSFNACLFQNLDKVGGILSYSITDSVTCKYGGRNSTKRHQGLIPDIPVKTSIKDCINGIDPDYEAVIKN